ncbi:hypothetical protein B296_00019307 [Ensete ventricosum]|uniref:Glutaredoxin domain-containing protein n=1 Tax=Ensete ventricosum TaxID=4639 RepID=A0A426YZD0_ENSVE|nr:hypothetical protein B296_00019307 [Ensete ventricosum]
MNAWEGRSITEQSIADEARCCRCSKPEEWWLLFAEAIHLMDKEEEKDLRVVHVATPTSCRAHSPLESTQTTTVGMEKVMKLASQRAVVVFSLSSCCMCHAVKSLFHDLGVDAAVRELDEDPRGREMEKALAKLVGRSPPVPVVFIGGKLVGSTDRIMSLHLGGKLVPLLRDAGALWV